MLSALSGPTVQTLGRLRLALARMGCPVFIAPGNHDPAVKNSPYVTEDWPDNVHIFLRPELEAVEVPELGCVVYGAAFTGPDRTDAVLEGFPQAGPSAPGPPAAAPWPPSPGGWKRRCLSGNPRRG